MRGPKWYGQAVDLLGQVPEAVVGRHAIIHRAVSDSAAEANSLRAYAQAVSGGGRVGHVAAGDQIVTLFRYATPEQAQERFAIRRAGGTAYGGTLVMSDTNDELRDMSHVINGAHGHVLVNGLGLGITVRGLLAQPDVERVTVIEKQPDVIELNLYLLETEPGPKLEIIEADAFEWQPPRGVRYSFAWHDIWDFICEDNIPEMTRLHRKYGRRATRQASWARELCRR